MLVRVAFDCSSLAIKRSKPREQMLFRLLWSEWRDSNSRHPGPKQSDNLFSNIFSLRLEVFTPKDRAFRNSPSHCFRVFEFCLWSNMWSSPGSVAEPGLELLCKEMLNFDNLRHADFPKGSLNGTIGWFGIPVQYIMVHVENLIPRCNDLLFSLIAIICVKVIPF